MNGPSRSTPHLFDQAVTGGTKCVINRFGEANCNHVHAGDLPSQNDGLWSGEPEDLIPKGWTAQHSASDPRVGQPLYECSFCEAVMTLVETRDHTCEVS